MLAEIDVEAEFENFIREFKKNYTTPEEKQEKFNVFATNIAVYDRMFRRIKVRPVRYFGKYSDMTNAEVTKRLGYNLEESINDIPKSMNKTIQFDARDLLPQVNWKDRNYVSYAKDQGKCGNSYIFATVAAIESHKMIQKKTFITPFSDQDVLNCLKENQYWRTDKCDGGTEVEVFEHA